MSPAGRSIQPAAGSVPGHNGGLQRLAMSLSRRDFLRFTGRPQDASLRKLNVSSRLLAGDPFPMRSFQIVETGRPAPEAKGTEMLLKALATGVCRSDLHLSGGYG